MQSGDGGFSAPIDLTVGGSWRLAGLSTAVHLAGALALTGILPPGWASGALILIVVAAGCWSARRFLGYPDLPVQRVQLFADGRWRVWCKGRVHDAELGDGCLVSPQLTILPLRVGSKRIRYVLLTTDNVQADSFRRLRVRLRYR